jgi:hypothetical protein
MPAPLDDEIALRIGLASRLLPGMDVRPLLQVLIGILGEPLTDAKLQKLRATRLRNAAGGWLAQVDPDHFQKALGLLKGRGVNLVRDPLPSIACGVYCELYGSVRVACASCSGEKIDGAFYSCARFLIYQVSPEYIRLIDIREPARDGQSARDRSLSRADLIRDCDVLYTTGIGAAAAASVVGTGLHPIKLLEPARALDELKRLQQVVAQDNPPPWLTKAMGRTPVMRRFNEEVWS